MKRGLLLFSLLIAITALGQAIYLNFFVTPSTTKAQSCADTLNPRFENGLLTTPAIPNSASRFGGTVNGTDPGPCIINPNAAQLATFQIPTYAELKRDFFEKVSVRFLSSYHIDKEINPVAGSACTIAGVPATEANLRFNGHDKLINFANTTAATPTNCDLVLSGNPSGNRSGLVFIDGDLLITANSRYPDVPPPAQDVAPSQSAGVIYIARGNVYIDRSVQTIDGVIMAGGTIFTSCIGRNCIPVDRSITTQRLVIYGNLISLGLGQPIQFERDLSLVNGNATPAEQVIADPKYLVLFHQLFAQTFSVQTEDTNFAIR